MDELFKTVAERLELDVSEVKKIYYEYVKTFGAEYRKTPYREIYFEKFGKIVPSPSKIKNKIRKAFQKRNVGYVTKLISILRKLNPKQK